MEVYVVNYECKSCGVQSVLLLTQEELKALEEPDNHACPWPWCNKGNLKVLSKKMENMAINMSLDRIAK